MVILKLPFVPGEERWKKNFFAEKKRFVVLEDKMKELRGSLRALQKAAEEESLRRVVNGRSGCLFSFLLYIILTLVHSPCVCIR